MTRTVPAVAVALLLLASGCLGAVGPLDGGGSAPEVASLVTEMDAADARDLVARHRATLANASSYAGWYERDENDTLAYKHRVVIDRDDRQFVRDWRNVSTASGVVFRNASGTYERSRRPGDESFRYEVRTGDGARFDADDSFASDLPLPDPEVLAGYDFEYVRSTDTLHYFRADGPDGAADVTDARARLVVHEDGYLRSLSWTVTVERGNEPTTLTRETTVVDLNTTDADRPDWMGAVA